MVCKQKFTLERVCGYFRPVAMWNRGKKAEFEDRVTYAVTREALEKQDEHKPEEAAVV